MYPEGLAGSLLVEAPYYLQTLPNSLKRPSNNLEDPAGSPPVEGLYEPGVPQNHQVSKSFAPLVKNVLSQTCRVHWRQREGPKRP